MIVSRSGGFDALNGAFDAQKLLPRRASLFGSQNHTTALEQFKNHSVKPEDEPFPPRVTAKRRKHMARFRLLGSIAANMSFWAIKGTGCRFF
jgi:hypothetical protein